MTLGSTNDGRLGPTTAGLPTTKRRRMKADRRHLAGRLLGLLTQQRDHHSISSVSHHENARAMGLGETDQFGLARIDAVAGELVAAVEIALRSGEIWACLAVNRFGRHSSVR
jgi:hypothetical protein